MARRPSTTGPRRIGMPSTTTGPMIIPGTEELPFKKIPPRKQFLQRPPSIEQRRPPTIEERVAQVLSGPSFLGRQMPKIPEQPMRMPEPVGPVTDMRTMPSMPTTGIASLSDVLPLLDMGGEDIMQLLSDLPKTPPTPVQPPVMPISGNIDPGSQIVDDEPYRDSYRMMEDPEERMARRRREMEESILNMPKLTTDPIPDPITGDRYPQTNDSNPYGFTPPPADSFNSMAFVNYYNPTTGETWTAPSGGWTAPPGWEVKPSQSFLPSEPSVPAPDVGVPAPEPMMPPAPETTPAQETGTTPVQGMTMEQMQQMIADMQAQQQEQVAARAAQEKEMAQNYMVPGSRMGYNPYQSGQYQSDPYGPSGVPNMGGITTIPVPDGYGIYNPVYGR